MNNQPYRGFPFEADNGGGNDANNNVAGRVDHNHNNIPGHQLMVAHPLTRRPPIPLYLSCDYFDFHPLQVLIRKNIEFFEALPDDVETTIQGRPRPVALGQVGMRCCFCSAIHPSARAPGATCYPTKLSGIYQAAQNIANTHWSDQCTMVPQAFKQELVNARNQRSASRASKQMWRNRATALGVFEEEHGLRFAERVNSLGFPSDD